MKYEDDVFISYAHIDNEPLTEGQTGWVQLLDERLRTRLAQLLGEPAKIWRDPKLQGNDEFSDILMHKISSVGLLVSIISPRYLKSEWCVRELDEFCRHAAEQGGVTLDGKSRIFKVAKTFTPRDGHPGAVQGLLGYEFYEYDETSGRAREFRPEIDPNRDARYWEKLEDLAWDIKQQIERLRSSAGDHPASSDSAEAAPADSSTGAVYVAETTSDLSDQRDKIKRELQQRGHHVLPDKELPLRGPELQEAVREYLKHSRLSVHLVGENYGIIPEMETERSVVRLQQELAIERGDDARFSRLIWIPPGLQPKDERQQKFVADLQNSFTSHNGSELLQVKLEDLKTIIQTKLTQKPKPAPAAGESAGVRLYLICDQQDIDAVEPLQNHLFERGCEVTLPLSDGSEAEVMQDHKENLLLCDGLLIFQGKASEGWLRMKLRELIKLPGYGRTTPLLGKAVYITAPELPAKERFKTLEALVIKNYGAFDPAAVEPLLTQINKAKGGAQ